MTEANKLTFKQDYKFFLDSSFFTRLRDIKLHQQKLSSDLIDLPSSAANFLNKSITLSSKSFEKKESNGAVLGSVRNFNTVEEFKRLDKVAYIKEMAFNKQYYDYFYHMIAFADLKKFTLVYWICVPTLSVKGLSFSFEEVPNQLSEVGLNDGLLFDVRENNTIICKKEFCDFNVEKGQLELSSFVRNIMIKTLLTSSNRVFTLLLVAEDNRLLKTFEITTVPGTENITESNVIVKGWEKNMENKFIPKYINFSSLLDPIKMNEQNVSLNLELMKWRINPDLDLDILKKQRVLLLGSGTLGCYISRCLLAWGIYDITFVDDGVVSHSNPVRQPLFNFEDVGKEKAETASANLKKIYPLSNSKFCKMKVPMIGHLDTIDKEVFLKLESLIEGSDIIFLLMDSREARWLPTLLAKSANKTVINTAIGYDTFLVMRHGDQTNEDQHLGCYFCSDILAPLDSLKDRALDQMCTVSRPGCAMMASSIAVEMLVDYLQKTDRTNNAKTENQIRGFLHEFSLQKNTVESYKHCSACSKSLVDEYRSKKWEFVKQALENPEYVEDISGLTAVHQETENLLEMMDDFSF